MPRLSSAQRRKEILQAALRVIQRDGVHGATTRAVVAEANMPLASFHYVFRSRDAMIRDLILYVIEGEEHAATATLSEGEDIRWVVRAGLQAYFELVTSEPNREQALFELFHYSLRHPELNSLASIQYDAYHRLAAALLITGGKQVRVRWQIPVEALARLLVTFTDGITLAWLADRDDRAARITMDLAADTIARYAAPLSRTKLSTAKLDDKNLDTTKEHAE